MSSSTQTRQIIDGSSIWKGLAYPSFSIIGMWTLLLTAHLLGVVFDHVVGGLLLWFVVIPWTITVLVLLFKRLPKAIAILNNEPQNRTTSRIAVVAISFLVILVSVGAFIFPQ